MAEWEAGEVADGGRDAVALVRASADGRLADITAILDAAGDRGTRCIAEVLAALAADLAARLTLATALIGDEEGQAAVATAGHAAILADPDLRAALDANLASLQANLAGG